MRGIGFGGLGHQNEDLSSGASRGSSPHEMSPAPHGRPTLQPVSSMSTPPRPSPLGFPLASDRSGSSVGMHGREARSGGGGGSGVLNTFGHRSTGSTSGRPGTQQASEWQTNLRYGRVPAWMSVTHIVLLLISHASSMANQIPHC